MDDETDPVVMVYGAARERYSALSEHVIDDILQEELAREPAADAAPAQARSMSGSALSRAEKSATTLSPSMRKAFAKYQEKLLWKPNEGAEDEEDEHIGPRKRGRKPKGASGGDGGRDAVAVTADSDFGAPIDGDFGDGVDADFGR